jgi:hypothetical protein
MQVSVEVENGTSGVGNAKLAKMPLKLTCSDGAVKAYGCSFGLEPI